MGMDRFSSKALPILAAVMTACAGAPATRLPPEHIRELGRSKDPDKAVSEAVKELQDNLKKASEILDPDIVICGDPIDEFHSNFSRKDALSALVSKYFENMGGHIEGELQRTFSILYLVKMPDGYQIFKIYDAAGAAKFIKGINFKDGVECIQAVPGKTGLTEYVTKVDTKGKNPKIWFDEEYKKAFPE